MVSLQPWTALTRARTKRGPEPLVTYIDARTGERTELSATSVENAVAKIANALRDECGLDHDSSVGLHLPWHWQRSLWWAASAAIGARVVPFADPGAVDLIACTPAEVASLSGAQASSHQESLVVSMHPLGLPLTEPLAAGFVDATVVVRAQPDAYWPDDAHDVDVPVPADAEPGQRTLVAVSQPAARELDDSWWWALAIPLAIDGSVVMVRVGESEDASRPGAAALLDRIAEQERVDRVVRLPG